MEKELEDYTRSLEIVVYGMSDEHFPPTKLDPRPS